MAKELERAGVPTALVTAMVGLAERVGAPRIVAGRAVIHPLGDPAPPARADHALRRPLIEPALAALETPAASPRIFSAEYSPRRTQHWGKNGRTRRRAR